jgi:hypothetical protein
MFLLQTLRKLTANANADVADFAYVTMPTRGF